MNEKKLTEIIRSALAEDIGPEDYTTLFTVTPETELSAVLKAKANGILAGTIVFTKTFILLNEKIKVNFLKNDSERIRAGEVIAKIKGPGQALLSAERTALNFLQRMSGIASETNKLVQAVKGTKAKILDTRKTAPGLRLLDKWAVEIGGGMNHRIGLFDMILIKDNHIVAAGGITEAVQAVRRKDTQNLKIEVEVKNLKELDEALTLNVDRIMLDNMSPEQMAEAVNISAGRVPLEASGNVSVKNIKEIADSGVDFISIGGLTHSVKALDMSLLIE